MQIYCVFCKQTATKLKYAGRVCLSVCAEVYTFLNSIIFGQILTNIFWNIMPVGITAKLYVLISYNCQYQHCGGTNF